MLCCLPGAMLAFVIPGSSALPPEIFVRFRRSQERPPCLLRFVGDHGSPSHYFYPAVTYACWCGYPSQDSPLLVICTNLPSLVNLKTSSPVDAQACKASRETFPLMTIAKYTGCTQHSV